MQDNTIMTDEGIEVYKTEICRVLDVYVAEQDNGSEDLIKSTTCFSGAIKRIYCEVFRTNKSQRYNRKTTVDTDDIGLLNDLWDLYCEICYKYRHKPTLQRFSIMIGVSEETFNLWRTGQTRGASREYIESLKRWRGEAESAQVDGLEANSIGSIFCLKSNFGWRETAPAAPPEIEASYIQSTPEQIAERYKDAKRPEIPDFGD